MDNNDAPLVYDPYSTDILGLITNVIKQYINQMQTCIPAIIESVDADRRHVIATPAVQRLDSKWNTVPWAGIKLPILALFGGGIMASWPLQAGDTGWIVAGDLDPSLFFQTPSRPQRQKTFDRHSYQYGFFIPDKIGGYTISNEDDGAFVIQTEDGQTKITLKSGTINITSSDTLNINGQTVNIKGNGNVYINGTDWKTHNHTVPQDIAVTVSTTTGTGATTATATTGGVN